MWVITDLDKKKNPPRTVGLECEGKWRTGRSQVRLPEVIKDEGIGSTLGISLPSPRPTQNSSTPPCLSLSLCLCVSLFNQKLASNTQPQSVILTLWPLLLLWCQNCVSLQCTITTSTIQSSDTKAKVSLALHHHPIFSTAINFWSKSL